MSMDQVKALMKAVGWGVLATTDGETVGVRPMGGWAWFDKELWCATMKSSDKVLQLSKVSHAEYCFGTQEGRHVRIAGPCTVSTDNAEKKKLYDAVPILREHIQDPAALEYVLIKMKVERVRLMNSPFMEYTAVEL